MSPAPLKNWRRVAAAKVARLTPAEAAEKLAEIRARGLTMDQPVIRELTGGFCSQSINFLVMRKLYDRAAAR